MPAFELLIVQRPDAGEIIMNTMGDHRAMFDAI